MKKNNNKRLNIQSVFNKLRLLTALLFLTVIACVSVSSSTFAKSLSPPLLLDRVLPNSVPSSAFDKSQSHKAPQVTVAPIDSAPTSAENLDDISHYSYTLEDISETWPINLHGVDDWHNLSFSLRSDEFVKAANLTLVYAGSPSLIPELSHLRVLLNDELMTSLPLPHEYGKGSLTGNIALNPNMFIDFNKLTLNLIAHYTRECEDPFHSTLWANISNQSKLELTVRHLKLANDMALLPAPFYDRLDNKKLMLPFVFSTQPGNAELRSAGIVASWFGGLASYRGAQFPALINTLPKGNGVVMVNGSSPPAGLGLPMVSGPSLAIITNPLNASAKLLVVMGRDANELDIAAKALTLGTTTLTGSYVNVKQMQDIPQRKPYDAPRWIPTDRPVHFGELAKPEQLQSEGRNGQAIAINFMIPPDIFSWRSKGVPLDLRYRYTQRSVQDRSTLNVNINNQFVQSLPLSSVPGKLSLPMIGGGKAVARETVLIPHQAIYGKNKLQLKYFFDYSKQGYCKDVDLSNEWGVIDEDSTMDFSAFPHYTALPNLKFFVDVGFPFSRMADLSETAVVMPDNASSADVETYLLVMGRLGNNTGYPALRHVIVSAANVSANSDKDLILIGTAGNQPLLVQWADKMRPLLDKGSHSLKLPGFFERLKSRWEERDLEDALKRAGDLISTGEGGLGALVGFESPLQSGRSVVVFTGDNPEQITTLVKSLADPKILPGFHGDLVLQSGKRIEGFQMGPTYYVGKLPWLTALCWYLSEHPLLLIIFTGVAALIASVVSFRYLRTRAAKRLGG